MTKFFLPSDTVLKIRQEHKSNFSNISYQLHILKCNQNVSHKPGLMALARNWSSKTVMLEAKPEKGFRPKLTCLKNYSNFANLLRPCPNSI